VVIPLKDEFLLELNNTGFFYYNFKRLKKEERIDYMQNVHLVKDSPLHMFYVDNKNLYMLNKLNDEHPIYHETLSEDLLTLSEIILTQSHILLSNVEGIHSISVRNNGVYFVNPNPKFDKNSVRATYFFDDGAQFFCSYKGAGYIDKDGTLTHLDDHKIAYRILPLDENRLLLTSEGSFLEVFDRRTKSISPYEFITDLSPRQIRENSYITAITEDTTYYYIGSYGGILKVNKETHEVLKVHSNQKDLSYGIGVRDLSIHNGELWVSSVHGLYQLRDSDWKKVYPKDRSETIHSHLRINDTIWLATQSSGLVALNPKGELLEQYTTKEGLTDNLIYQLDYRQNKLFAFTAYGFNLYYNHSIIPYYPKSKGENSEYNHGAIGYNPTNNTLYAGGINGYTTIDLDGDIADVKFPSYVISEVVTSNKDNIVDTDYNHSYINNSEITIPKDSPYIRLKFKQNELDVNAVRYEYLIPELFEEWRRLDISKSIELVGISPGTYNLKVRHPGDHHFNSYIISKEFYFYQRWWFYLLVVLLLLAIAYSYFKFRVNLIRTNERLRSRIAADLHDDIGSVLGGILAQSQYASLAPEKTPSILNRIQNNAKTGLQSLSDIVWSVDHKNDNWDSFLDKIEVHGNESTQNSSLKFEMSIEGTPFKKGLDQKLRQNLWLIFKESLMNCIKHSNATEFNVLIHFNKHSVSITFIDNGVGFEKTSVQLGNGLKNMKMRSELINASFDMSSKPGKTQIQISIRL
jgi:two-component sensor histidine kinase